MDFKQWLESKRSLPDINKLGKELSSELSLQKGPKRWNQVTNNCRIIAEKLANRFGYKVPENLREIILDYLRVRGEKVHAWGGEPFKYKHMLDKRSPAYIIVRETDSLNLHVSIEIYGKEYNYGVGKTEGYEVLLRIPLF